MGRMNYCLLLAFVLVGTTAVSQSIAQEPGCLEISRVAAMAKAKSMPTLEAQRQKASDSYRTRLVFAARSLEIEPQNRAAAELLLNLLPKDEVGPEQEIWMDLPQLQQCPSGGVADSDLFPLFKFRDRLPRIAAKAILLHPERMLDYISYGLLASGDVDSDYAIHMGAVCRRKHAEFSQAVSQLPPKDRKWFVSKLVDPASCKTLAIQEQ